MFYRLSTQRSVYHRHQIRNHELEQRSLCVDSKSFFAANFYPKDRTKWKTKLLHDLWKLERSVNRNEQTKQNKKFIRITYVGKKNAHAVELINVTS